MNKHGESLELTPSDIVELKNGGSVDFSHVISGYRLTISAEEIDLHDFVIEGENDE